MWYADGTFWAVAGVIVAVVSAGITVWAQFASAQRIARRESWTLEHRVETPGVAAEGAAAVSPSAHGLDLTGTWVAGWQSFKDGEEVLRFQPVEIARLAGETFSIAAIERGADIEAGGYLWTGELRAWDNAYLMGWYAATDNSVRSKGTLYYAVHPHGQTMAGRWVGLSHDGEIISGWASLGRSESVARSAIVEVRSGR
jgi:hypothetical protein